MPEKTLDAVADHGVIPATPSPAPTPRRQAGVRRAGRASASTSTTSFKVLEDEGVEKFEKSWLELLEATAGSARRRQEMTAVSDKATSDRTGWRNPLRDKRDKRLPRIAGPVRGGDLRGHRRPGPQEADAGDLRPGQPRPAAAGLRAGRVRPTGLGRRGLRARSSTTRSSSTPARRSARRSGDQLAEGIRFVQGTFDDDDAFDRLRRDARGARRGARHRRQPRVLPVDPAEVRSRWCASSCRSPGWPTRSEGRWRRVVIEKPFGHDLQSAP